MDQITSTALVHQDHSIRFHDGDHWRLYAFHFTTKVGTPLAKGTALKCKSTLFSFTTVNDKGLPFAKAGAGTHLPA